MRIQAISISASLSKMRYLAWEHAVDCGAKPVSREGPVEVDGGPNVDLDRALTAHGLCAAIDGVLPRKERIFDSEAEMDIAWNSQLPPSYCSCPELHSPAVQKSLRLAALRMLP